MRLDEGRDVGDVSSYVQASVGTVTIDSDANSFVTMTSAELDAADLHTEYLVEGILAAGQPCVIAASKKSLKTTTAIDLAMSLASRSPFLGKFHVPKSVRVALMSGESGDAVIQETARCNEGTWF